MKIPPMPWHELNVKFGYLDDEKKKRVYFADTYNFAVMFVSALRVWGVINPHDGGRTWKIEI